MAWIKRNLFFVIGAVVALALLGFAGFYNYTGWKHNTEEREKLNGQYEELKRLNNLNPHPGFGKVDNIKIAREQQKEIRGVLARAAGFFQPPPVISDSTNLTSGEFTAALRRTVEQLTREATRASVLLPPEYKFSFSQQFRLLNFAEGSLPPLTLQLSEVKALCDVLIKAKINSLDGIQRERVSLDDLTGSQTDYVELRSLTNEQVVLTPYQITFRSFSPEIAQVLAGFANSPHGIIVQSISVEPAAAFETPGGAPAAPTYYMPAPVAPVYRPPLRGGEDGDERERLEMLRARGLQAPAAPVYATTAPRSGPAGPQTVLNEKPLRVTLQLQLVKLLPIK